MVSGVLWVKSAGEDYVMTNQGADKPLLRLSDVKGWLKEVRDFKQERTRIDDNIRALENKLAAAKVFMGDLSVERLDSEFIPRESSASPPEDREPLPDAIVRIIREAGKPLTKIEIRRALEEEPIHAARFKHSPNYFYTAMIRLEKRGAVRRRGKKYSLTPKQHEAPDSDESSAPSHKVGGNGNPSSNGSGGTSTSLAAHPGAIPADPGL
ncbi:hypothetical protein JYU02_01250 [bacterium AH-315-P15]|nr:hypothetical protein [bacterium AH-315-P15]